MRPGEPRKTFVVHACGVLVRPCPETDCRHHLGVSRERGPRVSAPVVLDESETCALDVAARGKHTRDVIGRFLGLRRGQVANLEAKAIAKIKAATSGRNAHG